MLHRRLRPEEFAHRVDRAFNHDADYPVHPDLTRSAVLREALGGDFLLPMAYPEGSPAHPSYPAGHAVVAGACATALKAFFREDARYPAPVQPSEDGRTLVPYDGPPLILGEEIDKLAWNIAVGRNFAGVHYRSDAIEGLNLGEAVTIAYLAEARMRLTEDFDGFTFTTFDGKPIQV